MEHSCPHSIVTPRGTLTFNESGVSDYYFLTATEVGKNVRLDVHDLAQRDGFLVPDGYQGGVYTSLEGVVVASSATQRRVLTDRITSYLASILRADGTHKWTPSGGGTGYSTEILGDTPAGYWRLGESSAASAANDETANNNDGTYTGSPTVGVSGATSDGNTAVDFNGSSQYVTVPDHASLDVGDSFTVEAWLNPDVAAAANYTFFSKGSGGIQARLVGNGTTLKVQVLREGLTVIGETASTLTPAGGWYHVVWTKNGGTNKVYVNAVEGFVAGTPDTIANTATALNIGRASATSDQYFDGQIDEVAVYDSELTAQQVSDHYAAAASGRQRTVRAFLLPDPSGGWHKAFQLVLVSADPIAYSQTEQTSSDATINGATISVTNGGDTPVYPTIRVYGALTGGATDLRIDNETTSKYIRFDDTASIADGKYWEINCRNETVIDSDGVSRIGKLDATVSEFFTLEPGANAIDFDGTSPGGNAKGRVIWRDGWSD